MVGGPVASTMAAMFRHRQRLVKYLGIFLAISLALSLILPFLLGR